jgi:hypothetical protein
MRVNEHAAIVDAWLKRSTTGVAADVALRWFEEALNALWTRSATTLGDVTLTAIAERVLYDAIEKFPRFAALKVEPTAGIQCAELRAQLGSLDAAEWREGMRFVLVEFLTVLGHLTAEILSPALHLALTNTALPTAVRVPNRRATPQPQHRGNETKS